MLNFSLAEEQRNAVAMVKEFAEKEIYPTIKVAAFCLIEPGVGSDVANMASGKRKDKPSRCELPVYDPEFWESEE